MREGTVRAWRERLACLAKEGEDAATTFGEFLPSATKELGAAVAGRLRMDGRDFGGVERGVGR
eukprot:1084777-Pyramimonas_sp.AAC.1